MNRMHTDVTSDVITRDLTGVYSYTVNNRLNTKEVHVLLCKRLSFNKPSQINVLKDVLYFLVYCIEFGQFYRWKFIIKAKQKIAE